MLKGLFVLLSVFIMGFMTGCSNLKHYGSVDAYSSPAIEKVGRKYNLILGENAKKREIFEREAVTEYFHRALKVAGYEEAKSLEDTDLLIIADYGISDPKKETTVEYRKHYGATGVASSTTNGYVDSNGNYSGQTTYNQGYGVVAVTPKLVEEYYYTTQVYFSGMNFNRKDLPLNLFKVDIKSSDKESDLRVTIPTLLAATTEYIGKNTGKKIIFSIRKSDKRIREIEGVLEDKSEIESGDEKRN